MRVNTIEELTNQAVEHLNSGRLFEPVTFNEPIKYAIKLEGRRWDGYVDVAATQFVIDLQSTLRKLFEETLDVQNEDYIKDLRSKIVVKVQVESGCTQVIVEKIDKILEVILSNLSGDGKKSLPFQCL